MDEIIREIFKMTKKYFEIHDEDISDDFIKLLIRSVVDEYKNLRNYPDSWDEDAIDADAERYFERRKANVAMVVIPEIYGKIGAEGLSMLTDAGTTRIWLAQKYMNDVVPFCELI